MLGEFKGEVEGEFVLGKFERERERERERVSGSCDMEKFGREGEREGRERNRERMGEGLGTSKNWRVNGRFVT